MDHGRPKSDRAVLAERSIDRSGSLVERLFGEVEPPIVVVSMNPYLVTIFYNKISFDAIITVNDRLAFGAIECLQDNNINVPENIKVVSSQGLIEGLHINPPLTTLLEPNVYSWSTPFSKS